MRVLPRRFRPHTVKLIQLLTENEQGIAENRTITIRHVKVDTSYGIIQSKRGITTDDKIAVYVELADYTAYDENDRVLKYGEDFKIRPDDTLSFLNETYEINSMNEVLLDSNSPIRLEITAK